MKYQFWSTVIFCTGLDFRILLFHLSVLSLFRDLVTIHSLFMSRYKWSWNKVLKAAIDDLPYIKCGTQTVILSLRDVFVSFIKLMINGRHANADKSLVFLLSYFFMLLIKLNYRFCAYLSPFIHLRTRMFEIVLNSTILVFISPIRRRDKKYFAPLPVTKRLKVLS